MTNLKASLAALSLLAACGKGEDPASQCRTSADCGQGLVCVVSAGAGACQSPPVTVAMTAPAAGARVGRLGVPVQAQVTLGAADAAPPPSVVVVAGSSEAGALALTAREGAVLTYAGVYLPPAGVVLNALSLFVAAKTSAGSVPGDGVLVDVDTKAPVLTSSGVGGCGVGPCWRDARLDVFVQVEDDHPGEDVVALLDLDGYQQAFPFGPSQVPPQLLAQLPLRSYPFPRFSGSATPRIRARDTFGNEAVLDLPPVDMTRLRWAQDLRSVGQTVLQLTAPAMQDNRHVVIGGSDGRLHFLDADGQELGTATTVGSAALKSAPSIGPATIWIGSEDGKLYGVDPTLRVIAPACPTTAASGSMFTPAVRVAPETVYGSAASSVFSATGTACGAVASATDQVSSAVVISGDKLFLATTKTAVVSARRFSKDPSPELAVSSTCPAVTAPLAIGGNGGVVLSCSNANVFEIDPLTLAWNRLATFGDYSSASPVVFPNGDLLVGTNDGKLQRLEQAAGWNDAWSTAASLGAAVRGVAVSAPDADGVVAYATTAQGLLYALGQDGKVIWSTTGEPAPEPLGVSALSFPTIAPADGARPGSLPTLYAGSDDGHLYAVVVDTGLDPASPWPKAHRDLRNTSNADAPKDW